MGADGGGHSSGEAYLITAADLVAADAADGFTDGVIDLGNIAAQSSSYRFVGTEIGDDAGISVASAGDVDGDGLADGGGSSSGEAYLMTAADLAAADLADGTADGLFEYHPNGVYEYLPVGSSEIDSFTYELNSDVTATVTITIDGIDNNDVVDVTAGFDTLVAGVGDDTLNGYAAADSLDGGTGADSLVGGTGADTLRGGAGSDTLYGNEGADHLFGDGASDSLLGGSGDDNLLGGAGNDTLFGNQGVDTLDGGAGDDFLRGGTLADTFVFRDGGGMDVIDDFSTIEDILRLDDAIWGGGRTIQQVLDDFGSTVGGVYVLDFGDGQTITFNTAIAPAGLLDDITIF